MADAAAKLAPTVDARAAIDAIPRNYNFAADIIERNLKAGRADKPVFIDPRGSWTYGQLAGRVDRFGHVLRSLGVRREERILLALLDTIDWPTAFLGAIKAGVEILFDDGGREIVVVRDCVNRGGRRQARLSDIHCCVSSFGRGGLGGRLAHLSLTQRIMPTRKFAGNGGGRTFEVR